MANKDVIIARLQDENRLLREHVQHLQEEMKALREEIARLKKNSGNSSKPPSSDIVKPPKPKGRGRKKRKRGGQKGHKKHDRPAFPPEEIDQTVEYELRAQDAFDAGDVQLYSRWLRGQFEPSVRPCDEEGR